jgi:hypothetical protein
MKVLFGAAAAALLMASPVLAQTPTQTPAATVPAGSRCAGFAPAPALVDGAEATREQMQTAQAEWTAWQAQRVEQETACQAEVAALTAAFNAAGAERSAAATNFNTELTEFNARGEAAATPQRRRRDGGVKTRPDN